MKKIAIIVTFILLIAATGIGIFYLSRIKSVGALKVKTNVKGKVYLNEKFIGNAPLCKCEEEELIHEGEYMVKIIPEDSSLVPFAAKVAIHKDVLTYVERTFLPSSLAHAFIITLEKIPTKNSQLLVASLPSESLIFIDGNLQGGTPLLLKTIQTGEHELIIQKRGFSKRTLKIQTRPSYKLVVYAILGSEEANVQGIEIAPTPVPLAIASKSASIKILQTPTGFLNVRAEPSLAAKIVTKIYPGDIVSYLEEKNGWLKIELPDGTPGWIVDTYAEKFSKEEYR